MNAVVCVCVCVCVCVPVFLCSCVQDTVWSERNARIQSESESSETQSTLRLLQDKLREAVQKYDSKRQRDTSEVTRVRSDATAELNELTERVSFRAHL